MREMPVKVLLSACLHVDTGAHIKQEVEELMTINRNSEEVAHPCTHIFCVLTHPFDFHAFYNPTMSSKVTSRYLRAECLDFELVKSSRVIL